MLIFSKQWNDNVIFGDTDKNVLFSIDNEMSFHFKDQHRIYSSCFNIYEQEDVFHNWNSWRKWGKR